MEVGDGAVVGGGDGAELFFQKNENWDNVCEILMKIDLEATFLEEKCGQKMKMCTLRSLT